MLQAPEPRHSSRSERMCPSAAASPEPRAAEHASAASGCSYAACAFTLSNRSSSSPSAFYSANQWSFRKTGTMGMTASKV